MSLSRNEFKILQVLSATGDALTRRQLSERTGLSLGTVSAASRRLEADGRMRDGRITEVGIESLAPYKVDNAVIMAAGLSSRFAPLSYERPKGMLRVRGEIIIERQVEQLLERGITDISIVVGYKKEYFFYLAAKYGVKIVINNQYAERNNSWTLWLVKDILRNTYICSSDDYFTENPFERYVYCAYYAATYAKGKTNEWCIETGAGNRITGLKIGGKDSWVMLGHAYFDRDFSQRFTKLLGDEVLRSDSYGKLWEDIYAEHIKALDMEARYYDEGIINEFDSLDELRLFDPHFLENVDSDIFDNIVKVLGCSLEEIHDVYPLKQGLTNLSCHFSTNSGEYVYRHPGVGTELLIDRKGETAAQKVAKELGLDDTFIYEEPEKGWKISRFIPSCRNLDPHNGEEIAYVMGMAHRLHDANISLDRKFSFFDEANRYKSLLLEKGPIDIPGFAEMSSDFDRLGAFVRADDADICLCHNDFFNLNFLIDKQGKYYLIDWEYAGMGDYANDFGTFCVCCQLSEPEIVSALSAYFGRTPTLEETRHNFAMIALAGWCWYLWSLLKEVEGDYVGEWLYIYFEYARKYLPKALSQYHGEIAGEEQ